MHTSWTYEWRCSRSQNHKSHEVEENENEADSGRSSHQDSWEKINIDLVVMIKEDQQANIVM